ncbi:MAG: site-2 protease family protein [Actinobacteria bacterium]|nr:MAG: site-2 protease family protein [Actinomycetota bacterium]
MIGSLNLIAGAGVALGFLIGIDVHHWAHARAAMALGDRTPKLMGRVTLRIKPHVDTLGSIIMPAVFVFVAIFSGPYGMMFGWGKPQSFNPRAFKNPRRDMILVALAGPLATGVVAAVSAAIWRAELKSDIGLLFGWIMVVNSFLTVIELLPGSVPVPRPGRRQRDRVIQATDRGDMIWAELSERSGSRR